MLEQPAEHERLFYCHECREEIQITSSDEVSDCFILNRPVRGHFTCCQDPSCPSCDSKFLESLEEQEEPQSDEEEDERPIRMRLLHMELPPREERVGRRSPTDAELQESPSWRFANIDPSTGLPRNPMDDMHVVVNSLMEVGVESGKK